MILKAKFVIEPNLWLVFEDGDNDGYLSLHLEYNDYVWEGIDENQLIMEKANC